VAANVAKQGKNVLVISLEMSEMVYAKRIASNVTKIPMKDFKYNAPVLREALEDQEKKVPEGKIDEFLSSINQIKTFGVMPSMRSFYTAGKALERDAIAGYNCCAININTIKSFSELLYILMNGSGVGFSVERQIINNLPEVPQQFNDIDTTIFFGD